MPKPNPENEVAKRAYLRWLENAHGRDEATVDQAAAALARFEAHNGRKSFKTFNPEQAISFKRHLADQRNAEGRPLAKATTYATLRHLKAFFEWLSREQGYRRDVRFADAAYFKPTDNDARVATARRSRPYPSLQQVHHVLATMPTTTAPDRRDRAVVALIALTGARDAAVASLRLRHLDLGRRVLDQDAREVATKRAKTFKTGFYPIEGEAEAILGAWVKELTTDQLFGPDDPLFPATLVAPNAEGVFAPCGLDRRPWSSADPIRRIFKTAFAAAGLPYFNPHSLRQTIMRLGYDLNLSPRELKAWSQNLGHESVHTSLTSYGRLADDEQLEVLGGIDPKGRSKADPAAVLMWLQRKMDADRTVPSS